MYTSYIGKIFLDYYKDKNKLDNSYSAENFFDEVMFPLFFDDEKYLMRVKNSPFDQLTTTGAKKKLYEKQEERVKANNLLKEKIKKSELAVHTFVGFGEMNVLANTSGQISSIPFNFTVDEFYYSWIGQALAFKTGGLNILINDPLFLYKIFEGWVHYRKLQQDTPKLVKNQINIWNSQWIKHNLNTDINQTSLINNELVIKDDGILIQSLSWSEVLLILTKKYKDGIKVLYLYDIGDKNNNTLGFINLFLSEVNEMYEIRDKYFINEEKTILTDDAIMKLETFYNLKSACKFGSIGLKSLEPKQLRDFLPKGTYDYSKGNDFKYNENNKLSFLIIKLWIYAMLNKKELLELADKFAKILYEYETPKDNSESRGKTGKSQDVKELLENNSINKFLEQLTTMISEMKHHIDIIKNLEVEVLTMPRDNFPLFITLIKFEYTILKNSTQNKEK